MKWIHNTSTFSPDAIVCYFCMILLIIQTAAGIYAGRQRRSRRFVAVSVIHLLWLMILFDLALEQIFYPPERPYLYPLWPEIVRGFGLLPAPVIFFLQFLYKSLRIFG